MECLELLLSQFLVIYRQTLGEGGVNKEGMTKGRTSVLQFDSIEDMRDFLIRIGRNICTMLDAPENGKHKDIVETMAEYAQQHFDQEVTVKELAEKVLFMNQDYLSHLFVEKKESAIPAISDRSGCRMRGSFWKTESCPLRKWHQCPVTTIPPSL